MDSKTLVCCSNGCKAMSANTLACPANSLFVARYAAARDGAVSLFINVQAYLRCRTHNRTPPPELSEAWDRFHARYQATLLREVRRHCALSQDKRHIDDLCQEVWKEILVKLPDFTYCPPGRGLGFLLKKLTRRKLRKLLHNGMAYLESDRSTMFPIRFLPHCPTRSNRWQLRNTTICLIHRWRNWVAGRLERATRSSIAERSNDNRRLRLPLLLV